MLARSEGLDRLSDVSKDHLQLLKTMHNVGLKWVEKFLQEDASLIFHLGYHSVCNTFALEYLLKCSSFVFPFMPMGHGSGSVEVRSV